MGYAVIRYGVKAEGADENRALVAKVFEELAQAAPPQLQYLVLELQNGEFVHIVNEQSGAPQLPKLAAFKAFIEHHGDRRSTPVERSEAKIVGNYRMLDGPKPA